LHEAQHQHRDQRNPHLRLHRIGAGSQKRLDLQILLQRFKIQLHRPPGPVDLGDGGGGELEVVGQKLKRPDDLLNGMYTSRR
jgi:hypothetical protein